VKTVGASGSFSNRSVILFSVFVFLVGCSDALSYKVANLTDEQRTTLRQKLTTDQLKKLDDWVDRNSSAGQRIPAAVTVRQALKYQAEWLSKQNIDEAKAAHVREQAEGERAVRREEFSGMLSVALLSKKNKVQVDERRFVALEIAYSNKTDKDIQRVNGVLKISDIYGNTVIDIGRSFDRGIPARQTVVDHDAGVLINPLMEPQVNLWNTDFDKLKLTFEAQTILFKDGTSASAPE
jgi:hypothetical protein